MALGTLLMKAVFSFKIILQKLINLLKLSVDSLILSFRFICDH